MPSLRWLPALPCNLTVIRRNGTKKNKQNWLWIVSIRYSQFGSHKGTREIPLITLSTVLLCPYGSILNKHAFVSTKKNHLNGTKKNKQNWLWIVSIRYSQFGSHKGTREIPLITLSTVLLCPYGSILNKHAFVSTKKNHLLNGWLW